MNESARYAIYFAPAAGSALDQLGRHWLGRDAASDDTLSQPAIDGIAEITREPRHYGFHATLKPPFGLSAGNTPAMLLAELAAFVASRRKVIAPPLKLAAISGFLALVPSAEAGELDRLAGLCVTRFDRFRAPPGPEEIAKRRSPGLTPEQDALLLRWGYPYVFEQFRFHMTLTGRLPGPERARIEAALKPLVGPATAGPLVIDALSLFAQADRDKPFRLLHRFPLG